jgi:hypothetical protein
MTEQLRINLSAVGVAVVAALAFYSYHAISPDLIGIDGYFHTTFSRWIGDNGLVYAFEWLPFTIYADSFVDDHLLFHLLLAPFTGFGDILGGQIYATAIASAVFALFYLILANYGIRSAPVWTLGLGLSCYTFIFRLCLVRPPGLSLLILLIGCWLILDGRDRWLAPLGFIYALSYGGFPLLIMMAAVSRLAHQLYGSPRWRALGWASAGCAAGLILNPYFPENLVFLWKSYTQIELGNYPAGLVAGNEGYPYAASTAIRKAWIVWSITFGVIGPTWCVRFR